MSSNLTSTIAAGQAIGPWLVAGPWYEDLSERVQGLSSFERVGATVDASVKEEIVADALRFLQNEAREGQSVSFRGQQGRWEFERRPDRYLSWGEYFIANHLGIAFVSTLVKPAQAGKQRFQLSTLHTGQLLVAINGKLIFDSASQQGERRDGFTRYSFEAELEEGEQALSIGMFRIARMAQAGFALALESGELSVRVPISERISYEARQQIEEQIANLSLGRDLFYPNEQIEVKLGVAPNPDTRLNLQLYAQSGELVYEIDATAAGRVSLGQGSSLPDGRHRIVCRWFSPQEELITATSFNITKISPQAAPKGDDQIGLRRQKVLEHYSRFHSDKFGPDSIWPEVAKYARGLYDQVDENIIAKVCAFVAARKDCADFTIQGLLRIMQWERQQQRLSDGINALMKDAVLGFKYWVDEPGDTVMYMGSENHRLLFHVAEWMAGQLFPTDEFSNSRQRGLYHATKGRMYITEWLRQRGRFGFDEWNSNAYFPICIAPLLNVYDFAIYEDDKLRQMAGAVLDYMHFILAADSLNGVLGTTHGRSYARYLIHPDFEGTSPVCWLLFGTGSLTFGTSGMAPVSLASSHYNPPSILSAIAYDREQVSDGHVRQGVFSASIRHAHFGVYRTPDYLVSGLQDHRKGEYESSTHVAQVTLLKKTVVFWSCPHTSGEGSGLRPDYWSGHTTLPRVIHYRNLLALSWRLSEYAWMSHCFFEQERFDEVRFAGDWVFGRVDDAYLAIYVKGGPQVGKGGQYSGRELICREREHTWLAECGRKADWGSFDAFVEAISAAEISEEQDVVRYHSPSAGLFETGWDVQPTIDGQPIELRNYAMVDNAWGQARFGSGELRISYGDQSYEIWFNH